MTSAPRSPVRPARVLDPGEAVAGEQVGARPLELRGFHRVQVMHPVHQDGRGLVVEVVLHVADVPAWGEEVGREHDGCQRDRGGDQSRPPGVIGDPAPDVHAEPAPAGGAQPLPDHLGDGDGENRSGDGLSSGSKVPSWRTVRPNCTSGCWRRNGRATGRARRRGLRLAGAAVRGGPRRSRPTDGAGRGRPSAPGACRPIALASQ